MKFTTKQDRILNDLDPGAMRYMDKIILILLLVVLPLVIGGVYLVGGFEG